METPFGKGGGHGGILLTKACHTSWVNKSGVAWEGCKSLRYCYFGIMNGGKYLGFFQVLVSSEKQLCKGDCSPPVLIVSRWRRLYMGEAPSCCPGLIPGWCLPLLSAGGRAWSFRCV